MIGRSAMFLLAAALALAVGACGGASSSISARASSNCGTVPSVAPKDPSGVLAQLPAVYRQSYNGYPGVVRASPWANWKPKGEPPYTVGISFNALSSTFQTDLESQLEQALKQSKLVGHVVFVAVSDNKDVPGQLQQFQSLVSRGVNLIISQPLAVQALAPLVNQAGKAGIPTVTILDTNPSRYSVNVTQNVYLQAAETAAQVASKVLKGSGNVLENHSIPGYAADALTFQAWQKVLAFCPGIKVVGDTTGFFSPPATKAAVIQFLSTHPAKVDAVFDVATGAPAIISAFQAAGRPVPPVLDIGAQRASLAYWRDHQAKGYESAGTVLGAQTEADVTADVALRMLQGQGVKITDIVGRLPIVTGDNLAKWVKPDWTVDTPGTANGPPGYFLPDSYLQPLFNRFGKVK
ncbi:MAG: substrate-binding domain-containing protein [Solirubrobacteraceae bacterium]